MRIRGAVTARSVAPGDGAASGSDPRFDGDLTARARAAAAAAAAPPRATKPFSHQTFSCLEENNPNSANRGIAKRGMAHSGWAPRARFAEREMRSRRGEPPVAPGWAARAEERGAPGGARRGAPLAARRAPLPPSFPLPPCRAPSPERRAADRARAGPLPCDAPTDHTHTLRPPLPPPHPPHPTPPSPHLLPAPPLRWRP